MYCSFLAGTDYKKGDLLMKSIVKTAALLISAHLMPFEASAADYRQNPFTLTYTRQLITMQPGSIRPSSSLILMVVLKSKLQVSMRSAWQKKAISPSPPMLPIREPAVDCPEMSINLPTALKIFTVWPILSHNLLA